jgi:putative selenium metabolism protein SsnA
MLIVNGRVVTMEKQNRILDRGALLIRGGVIDEVGPQDDLCARYPNEEPLDAKGQLVMPANICAHTHFYGAFARGLGIPGSAPADFPQILQKLWWGLDRALTPVDIYYSAMVCLLEAVRHGTTTLIDHHASPYAIDGSLDEIARAVLEVGVRASLCYEVTDRDGEGRAEAGIAENLRFLRRIESEPGLMPVLSATFGLHASLTISEKTLRACRQAVPERIGFHVHVAEHPVDEYDSLEKYGQRVVDRLERHGILGPHSIVGHAVHVDSREIEILARTGTWVTHQPRSNMNNAVGLPQVESMLRSGVKVCLGNDGFSNAMWEEWKTAYLAHKLLNRDPRSMPGDTVMQMAVYNNSDLVHEIFGGLRTGILAKSAAADILFVDYHPYTPLTTSNMPWHILFGFHESQVTTTICGGKILMRDRRLVFLDEERIFSEALEKAPDVWRRYSELVGSNGSVNG